MFTNSLPAARKRFEAGAFDGTNDYLVRGGGLTGAADSKTGILSVWLLGYVSSVPSLLDILDASTTLGGATVRFSAAFSSDLFTLTGWNAAGSIILSNLRFDALAFGPNGKNHYWHILASWDLSVGLSASRLYVNDYTHILHTGAYTNDNIDFTTGDWSVGADPSGGFKYPSSIGELYFAPGQYLDFDVEANRRRFITSDLYPANLGPNGSRPTGVAPLIYLSRRRGSAAATLATNRGTGGNFSVNGALGDDNQVLRCPVSPFKYYQDTIISNTSWIKVAYSPELGLFAMVAISSSSSSLATSSDGINWTTRNLLSLGWNEIIWVSDLDLFIVLRVDGAATSPDGTTWTSRTIPSGNWDGFAWSPSLTLGVAVAYIGTNAIATTPDGVNWTARTPPASSAGWNAVAWSPSLGLFCATSFNNTANGGLDRIMTSPDGINWTLRTASVVGAWEDIEWSPTLGLFAAISNDGLIMTSPDGVNWTTRTTPVGTPDFRAIRWVGAPMSKFLACSRCNINDGNGLLAMVESSDGATWTAVAAPITLSWNAMAVNEAERVISCIAIGTSRPISRMTY